MKITSSFSLFFTDIVILLAAVPPGSRLFITTGYNEGLRARDTASSSLLSSASPERGDSGGGGGGVADLTVLR